MRQSIVFAVAFGLIFSTALADEIGDIPIRHQWKRITYPSIPSSSTDDQTFSVLVRSGHGNEKLQLQFAILWSGPGESGPPTFLGDADAIAVRLHMPDGTVVEANRDFLLGWIGAGGSFGLTWSMNYTFPWGPNRLEEAWFELRTMGAAYWIEVPYGFTRDPAAPLAPPRPDVNSPVFVPAMAKLAKGDRVVAWSSVEYDVGEIAGLFQFGTEQLNRRLTVYQSNPFDSACRLSLYGVSDLHDARTSVEIEQEARHRVVGRCVNLAFRDGTLSRIDSFKFNRNPIEGRDWGKLKIIVAEDEYFVVMPSSLLKYVHGVSDPCHEALIRSLPEGR